MLGATIGFLTGSGGLDANGGVLSPDVDLLFGIGAHRSVFTHSFVLGAAAEATILSVAELSELIHNKLPVNHDVLWDHLATHGRNFALGLATGYGVGLAYHLGIDATVQAAPLHSIPVPMPMEAHQAVMLGSAVAEVTNNPKTEPNLEVERPYSSNSTKDATRIAHMVREGRLSPDDAASILDSILSDSPPWQSHSEKTQGTSSVVRDARTENQSRWGVEPGTTVPFSPRVPYSKTPNLNLDAGKIAQRGLAAFAGITVALVTYPLIGPGGTVLGLGTVHLLRPRG
jgi:hypothetical protein